MFFTIDQNDIRSDILHEHKHLINIKTKSCALIFRRFVIRRIPIAISSSSEQYDGEAIGTAAKLRAQRTIPSCALHVSFNRVRRVHCFLCALKASSARTLHIRPASPNTAQINALVDAFPRRGLRNDRGMPPQHTQRDNVQIVIPIIKCSGARHRRRHCLHNSFD